MSKCTFAWAVALTIGFALLACSRGQDLPTKIVNDDGWSVPGIGVARVTVPRKSYVEGYDISVLEPRHPYAQTYDVVIVSMDSKRGVFLYQKLKVVVLKILRFEVRGRVFCYQVSVVTVSYNPRTRVRGGYGGGLDLIYYDKDGFGKFTVLDIGNAVLPWEPEVPSWSTQK